MASETFHIRFDFLVQAARFTMNLEADVQEHHSETYYVVTNFRVPGTTRNAILPEITIQKRKDSWVHRDSGQVSELSAAVGAAIDAYLRDNSPDVAH